MKNPFLIGERCYLRPLDLGDVSVLTRWLNDADVWRTLDRFYPLNELAEEDFIRNLSTGNADIVVGAALHDSDDIFGVTGFHRISPVNRHAYFGIVIGDKPLWNNGLGTEMTKLMLEYAFDTLNLNRVWLEVYDFNERGVHIYEKLGFREEGRLRQHVFRDGRYWDVVVMGILRDER